MKKILLLLSLSIIFSCKNNNEKVQEDIVSVDSTAINISDKAEIVKIDSSIIKKLKPDFIHKTDEFSENKTTWVTPKAASKYRNMNGIYCYFSNNNLRFVLQYHSDNWLFIKKAQFLVDGKAFEYLPEDVKRDNDETGITEWFDEPVSNNKELILAITKAKKAKIKLIGDQYVDYRTLTAKQINSIKETVEYYKALGNAF